MHSSGWMSYSLQELFSLLTGGQRKPFLFIFFLCIFYTFYFPKSQKPFNPMSDETNESSRKGREQREGKKRAQIKTLPNPRESA